MTNKNQNRIIEMFIEYIYGIMQKLRKQNCYYLKLINENIMISSKNIMISYYQNSERKLTVYITRKKKLRKIMQNEHFLTAFKNRISIID